MKVEDAIRQLALTLAALVDSDHNDEVQLNPDLSIDWVGEPAMGLIVNGIEDCNADDTVQFRYRERGEFNRTVKGYIGKHDETQRKTLIYLTDEYGWEWFSWDNICNCKRI